MCVYVFRDFRYILCTYYFNKIRRVIIDVFVSVGFPYQET
jgi:hypothetical protein